jgi:hypothetical protein
LARISLSVVDKNRRVRQLLHGLHDLVHIVAPQRTGAHLVRVHPGPRTQQPKQQRFPRHFEREHADHFLVFDGSVLGNIHGEGGLSHGGTGRDDDQIRTLQAAGLLVQIGVMGGQSGDALAALQQGIDRSERFLDDFLHAHETAADAFFRELKDGGLDVVENFLGGVALVGGARNRGIGSVDQSAQQRFIANNLDVVLDAGPVGYAIHQAGDVTHIADGLEFLVAVEFLDQGDHVDRPGRLGQVHHAGVNAAMRIEREIFRLEVLSCLVVRKIIQQDGAENGAFGFHVCREAVRETVVSGGQGLVICKES